LKKDVFGLAFINRVVKCGRRSDHAPANVIKLNLAGRGRLAVISPEAELGDRQEAGHKDTPFQKFQMLVS
jgi:hypothetical protein